MTRIRQWILAAVLAALMTLSFSAVASADPGDHGFGGQSGRMADPGDNGFGGW